MLSELLSQIELYLDQRITLEQLEDWLAPRSPGLLLSPDSDVGELVGTVELGLAEMSIGAISEEEFRALLRDSIPMRAEYPGKQLIAHTTSSSSPVEPVPTGGSGIATPVWTWA